MQKVLPGSIFALETQVVLGLQAIIQQVFKVMTTLSKGDLMNSLQNCSHCGNLQSRGRYLQPSLLACHRQLVK